MNGKQAERYERFLSLRLEGRTYGEIAKLFSVSHQYIQQVLRPTLVNYIRVRMRAKWQCEKCGIEAINGHIHHQGKANFEEYNNLNRLRWLCPSCHMKIHHPRSKIKSKKNYVKVLLRIC